MLNIFLIAHKTSVIFQAERTFDYNPELLNQVESGCDSFKSKTFGFSAEEVAEEIRFRIYQVLLLQLYSYV